MSERKRPSSEITRTPHFNSELPIFSFIGRITTYLPNCSNIMSKIPVYTSRNDQWNSKRTATWLLKGGHEGVDRVIRNSRRDRNISLKKMCDSYFKRIISAQEGMSEWRRNLKLACLEYLGYKKRERKTVKLFKVLFSVK